MLVVRREFFIRSISAQEQTFGLNVAVDRTIRLLMPPDVECAEVWKELKLAVGQMVVNPVGHCSPVGTLVVLISEPRYCDACHGAATSAFIEVIPNVARIVAFVRSAVVAVFVAQGDRKSVVVGKECRSLCRSRWSPYH